MEVLGLGLQPVQRLGEAVARRGRVQVQQHRQIGDQSVGGPAGDPGDLAAGKVASGALVGGGGVHVTVRYDDGAALQRRTDHRVDVLGPVSRVEQGLGAVRDAGVADVQQHGAEPLADGAAAGLAGDHDLVALAADPLGQGLRLGGLAGPVAALQGDEVAGAGPVRDRPGTAAQAVPDVPAERGGGPAVVGAQEQHHGEDQQQQADDGERQARAAVVEVDRAGGLPPERRRDQRADQQARRGGDPDHRLQVLGDQRLPGLLGLQVEQHPAGADGDAGGESGQAHQQQRQHEVRHQTGQQQRQRGGAQRQRQQPAAAQHRQHRGGEVNAEGRHRPGREHQQAHPDRPGGEVVGVRQGDADDRRHRGDGSGDGEAEQHRTPGAAGLTGTAALAVRRGAERRQRGARRARPGRDARQFLQVEQHRGGDQEARGTERRDGADVVGEPVAAGGEAVLDQAEPGQRGSAQRQRRIAGPPVDVTQHRALVRDRDAGRRGRQQPTGHRPARDGADPLRGPQHKGGDDQPDRRRGMDPHGPERCDADQHGGQHVRTEHAPAPVRLVQQPVHRLQQQHPDDQRRQQPGGQHGGDPQQRVPVDLLGRGPGHRDPDHEHQQDQQGQPVADRAQQLRSPQPLERAHPQQRPGPLGRAPAGDEGERRCHDWFDRLLRTGLFRTGHSRQPIRRAGHRTDVHGKCTRS